MSERKVYRTIFQVEVFHDTPLCIPDDYDLLAEVGYLITDGPHIGQIEELSSELVPADELTAHLLRIGNDGTFYDDETEA